MSGRSWAKPCGESYSSALLKRPAGSGDTEHATAPPCQQCHASTDSDSGDSPAVTVNVAGQGHCLLNPTMSLPGRHHWPITGGETEGCRSAEGSHSWEGSEPDGTRPACLLSPSSRRLYWSRVVMWARIHGPRARTHSHGPGANWSPITLGSIAIWRYRNPIA